MNMNRQQRQFPSQPQATSVITALLVGINLSLAASVGVLQYLPVFLLALLLSLGLGHVTEQVTKKPHYHQDGGREEEVTTHSCGIPGMEDARPMLAQAKAA